MTPALPVLAAVTGPWEAPLVAGLDRGGEPVRVIRRCADLAELLAAATAGLARVAVVSADLPGLDRTSIARLLDCGVAVVGLVAPAGPARTGEEVRLAERRMGDLGAAIVLPADSPPDAVAAAVIDAAGSGAPPAPRGETAEPRPSPGLRARGVGRGSILAVWGPYGSPGRTTVAVTLAAEFAALGRSTLLIDADTYGASIAQALGLLDESAGLAAAVRLANQGDLDVTRLGDLAPTVTRGLRVLTGLPLAHRWPELRPAGLEAVWEQARGLSAWTVIDCGFGIDTDDVGFDAGSPRRHGSTLSALAAADTVVAVGTADPIGLQRLVRGLQDIKPRLRPGAAPVVVATRVRAGAVGSQPQRRVAEALERFAGVADPVLVPEDREACDAAMLAGRALTEVATSSPARQALAALATRLCGTGVEPGSRRRGALTRRPRS